jgi:hypothetical protein
MTKRRGITVAAVVGLAVFLAYLGLLRPTVITRQQFDQIEVGMRRETVTGLLGGRPRNEEYPDPVIVWVPREGKLVSAELSPETPAVRFFPDADPTDEEYVWVSRQGLVAARFGDDGRLREKYFSTVHGLEGNLIQTAFRRAFGRRAMSNTP